MSEQKKNNWINYVKGVFWILSTKGYPLSGLNVLISGDIPLESGLSSSAALEICVINGLNGLFHLARAKAIVVHLSRSQGLCEGVACAELDGLLLSPEELGAEG